MWSGTELFDSPSKGTDIEVEGIISAKSKKKTVSESKMEMDKETYWRKKDNSFNDGTMIDILL